MLEGKLLNLSLRDGKTKLEICLAILMAFRHFLPKTMNDGYVVADTREAF